MSLDYKQNTNLFEFDYLKCLRTDYFHNDCKECLDICPEDAIGFVRGRLRLLEDKCTNCAVCIGVCPSEALSVEFFDPDSYIVEAAQKDSLKLSCKEETPCLSVFDVHHFISGALRCGEIICDLSHCAECNLNIEGKTFESINERIEEAKSFIEALGVDAVIKTESGEKHKERRAFFKKIFTAAKELSRENNDLKSLQNAVNRVPVKHTILKNSIKQNIESIQNTQINRNFSFIRDKEISYDLCDNCGECVQFCPTDALFYASEGTSIWFMSGKCIACGICNDICKPGAVSDKEGFDLVEFAFDRGKELVRHKLEICRECRTPFPYKSGELLCQRCKEFAHKYEDIFKLASDIED
ncbi:4Fe-4S binding protein [Nitrosophilus alvini]|uniref:4Fe-4S binding protein n=1 Tax=Nitrosophilus alvini TaxID=2714855 RepID=UPI00190A8B77|nr:4Fe-4S binding protein [Nitrosophilus alvini]